MTSKHENVTDEILTHAQKIAELLQTEAMKAARARLTELVPQLPNISANLAPGPLNGVPKKRVMRASARARIADAQRERWRQFHKAKKEEAKNKKKGRA